MLTAALRTDGMQNKHLTPTQSLTYITDILTLLFVLILIIVDMMLTICFSFLLDDYKDYGANCEGMAAEIEDYILSGHYWLTIALKISVESS